MNAIKNQLTPLKKYLEELEAAGTTNKIRKLEETENERKDAHKNRWKTLGWFFLNVAMNLIWVTIAAYVLWKLGLQGPPGGIPGVP